MVLLTPSAISAAISAAVVCLFTFLLFLSGYVLQQQTVRSLQEALRQPPAPKPIPTLPAAFQNQDNVTEGEYSERFEHVVVSGSEATKKAQNRETEIVVEGEATTSAPQEEAQHVEASNIIQDSEHETPLPATAQAPESQSMESLGYILSLSSPSDFCSAVLFAKWQRQITHLHSIPTIMILYPTTWESSGMSHHISALTFMRDMQDELSLTYHPVEINPVWSGIGLSDHLLGEVQRIRWDFDRAMYLKSPGLAVDIVALDRALATSNIKSSWAPLSASAGQHPELLFYSRKKGLMMARGEMRKLTAPAMTTHANHHAGEMDIEAAAHKAAYVLFNEEELDHRRHEKEWYGGVFERFERERRSVCHGRGLLTGEDDKFDLRRRSR